MYYEINIINNINKILQIELNLILLRRRGAGRVIRDPSICDETDH